MWLKWYGKTYFQDTIDEIVVKRFSDIPINHGLLKEKNETGSNFTVPVFLQYDISLKHQKVWFSQKILTEIDRILNFRKIAGCVTCWPYCNMLFTVLFHPYNQI